MLNKLIHWLILLSIMPTWVMMFVIIFEEARVDKVHYIIPNESHNIDFVGPEMTLPKDDTIYMDYVYLEK